MFTVCLHFIVQPRARVRMEYDKCLFGFHFTVYIRNGSHVIIITHLIGWSELDAKDLSKQPEAKNRPPTRTNLAELSDWRQIPTSAEIFGASS